MERNFANADQRAQQLEREVGQLLGELSHEQSKVEEVRLELNAVSQQNAELCAELEQFRIQADASELNDIKDEDENMVCLFYPMSGWKVGKSHTMHWNFYSSGYWNFYWNV